MREGFLTVVRMDDAVDEINFDDLIEKISARGARVSLHSPSIIHQEFGAIFGFTFSVFIYQRTECGIEKIEDEPAATIEMMMRIHQALHLIVNGCEVLIRSKGNCDKVKGATCIESTHIALRKRDPVLNFACFVLEMQPAQSEHSIRQIETQDLDSGSCGGDQNPPGPATHL
jgi:hypothetical protein